MSYIAELIGAIFITVALVLGAREMLRWYRLPRRRRRREED